MSKRENKTENVLKELQEKIQKVFMERISELIGDGGYQKFAEKVGSNRSSIYNYANGVRFPTAVALYNIAEKCDVTVDWLLGRE